MRSLFPANNAPVLFCSLFIAVASSLAPDIDCKESKISRLVGFVAFSSIPMFSLATAFSLGGAFSVSVFATYAIVGFVVYFIAAYFLRRKHRGITHSLLALVLYSAGVFAISSSLSFFAASFVGYGSHLLADWEIKLV